VRGMWISGSARRGVLRMRVGGRAAAPGQVTLRAGGRLTGRLGGRRVRHRLPGYGSTATTSAFRGGFVTKSSRSRLVPLRVR
jgi:hypothetical protein